MPMTGCPGSCGHNLCLMASGAESDSAPGPENRADRKTIEGLGSDFAICVIEGDPHTCLDSDRIHHAGAQAFQITPGADVIWMPE